MANGYKLEKAIWNEGDFDQMGWHDATIYGIAFGPGDFELCLDIDYIFKWVHPLEGKGYYQFWVCPCTLVFQNVYELRLDADPYGGPMLSIDEINREDANKPKNAEFIGRDTEWLWTISCHHGEITFRSIGFVQYVRSKPILTQSQTLGMELRGGFCFNRRYDGS